MKFRAERDSLAEVLTAAGRAAGSRGGASAVLAGLLLRAGGNRLEVTGTDLDLTIRIEHEVIGLEDGSCVVPARLTADVVRSLEPGAVTVLADDEKVEIASARARFGLRAFPVVEFPVLPPPPLPTATLPRLTLTEGLRQVVRAASGDDARPLLTGVLLTSEGAGIRLVATDSYRLALRDLDGGATLGDQGDILVPARALGELQRLATGAGADAGGPDAGIGLATGPTDISFTSGPVRISTRLLDGTYPDYRQLIPERYPNRLHTGRESLLGALRRVRLLVRDNTTPVRLSMRQGGVDLTVVSQEVGDASETVDGDYTGEDLVIAFNPSYLIDGVEAVLDDEVFIETDNPSRPATVRAAGRDDFRYLLMPVRVSLSEATSRHPATRLLHLWVRDLRTFAAAELDPAPEGTTVLTGPNGAGKTTLLEAVAYLGTQRSFRTAAREAMVRTGAPEAVIRASFDKDGRGVLVEAALPVAGHPRTLVNRQAVRGRSELADAVPVTVFSPEDLALVQGPPARRRELLDGAIRVLDRRAGAELDELERILRQRTALLRQAGGRLRPDVATTLDVWDDRLARTGEAVRAGRAALVEAVRPLVDDAYRALVAPAPVTVSVCYQPSWDGPLAAALAVSRADDVRRAVSTVGPHRDDLALGLDGRDARAHASQGEQRSLALALRLGVHQLVTDRRGPPILLLDDVFSELDPARSHALVAHLPPGQALCTTAMPLPGTFPVAKVVDVRKLAVDPPPDPAGAAP